MQQKGASDMGTHELQQMPVNLPAQPAPKRVWVVPSNVSVFDVQSCVDKYGFFFVPQNDNFRCGDIVYLFSNEMFPGIYSRFTVGGINLPFSDEMTAQDGFWNDASAAMKAREHNRYVRFIFDGQLKQPAPMELIIQMGFMKKEPYGASIIDDGFRRFLECE